MMTEFQKLVKASRKPPYLCHGANGQTATFTDLSAAQQWCTLRQGYIKARIAPGQYQIIYSARPCGMNENGEVVVQRG